MWSLALSSSSTGNSPFFTSLVVFAFSTEDGAGDKDDDDERRFSAEDSATPDGTAAVAGVAVVVVDVASRDCELSLLASPYSKSEGGAELELSSVKTPESGAELPFAWVEAATGATSPFDPESLLSSFATGSSSSSSTSSSPSSFAFLFGLPLLFCAGGEFGFDPDPGMSSNNSGFSSFAM